MKKIAIAAMTVAFTVGGMAAPLAASASVHHAKHHKHSAIKNAPCNGLGIDLALGSLNICIPL